MPKIKVFVTLENKLTNELLEKTYDGFLTTEKLVYKEDNRIVTIYRNSNTITMIRREQESVSTLRFIKGKTAVGTIALGELKPINIETETTLLEQKSESFHICYQTKTNGEIMAENDLTLHYEVRE